MLKSISPRWLLLAVAGLAAIAIAGLEYRALSAVELDLEATGGEARVELPWGGFAGRRLSAMVEANWRQNPGMADSFLAWQLQRYPVDHSRWYTRAIIGRDLGRDPDLVRAHLEAAVAVQPGHREGRWRAATLAQLLGEPDRAAVHLRRWLEGQPRATGQVLFAAGRWIQDPDALLDRVVPEGEAYLSAVLRYAREHGRTALARAAWERLPRPRPAGDAALLDFVDLALGEGDVEAAMTAWSETYPDYRPGQVPNGDFLHPVGSGRALEWDTRMPAGSQAILDTRRLVSEPASLRLEFDGKETLRLMRPSIRVPVTANPGGWVLSGHWRAERLTTRALPYLDVRPGNGDPVRVDVPAPSFDWKPFRVEIAGSDQPSLLHLRLRRDPSVHHFDRFLAGTVWLDALRLEPRAP
ncbi:tetratricopeptide repeat protein [Thioalkalivibrio sp.]|uniref:tetratricopeptide repeat protein n=1 Tax=Thioalkalivibrio sp. TaxID=2093813 RepID=UPI0039766ACD